MTAILPIVIFLVAIIALNIIQFGRPDYDINPGVASN